MDELILRETLRPGSKGKGVKEIQEWLCLHGVGVVIDGDFGPATQFGVQQFQKRKGLKDSGIVGKTTYDELVLPMREALRTIPSQNRALGSMVVGYARQHWRQKPREVGGENRGPWVRRYMGVTEAGEGSPWCAGFVSFILIQACQSRGVETPIKVSASCSTLAKRARDKNMLFSGARTTTGDDVRPGCIFLSRGGRTGYLHTGIVTQAEQRVFLSVEGNTNDKGSPEGYEVCTRIRSYEKKDFILL